MADSTIAAISSASSVASDDELILQKSGASAATKTTFGAIARAVAEGSAGFLQSGSDAEARSLQDKMREVISVKDFGATGDGSTDDTDALNAAVDAAAGRKVFLPAGTYKHTAALTASDWGTVFSGEGNRTILKPVGNFNALIFSSTSTFGGAGVENLYIDASGMTGGYVFEVNGAARTRFQNVKVISGYNLLYGFKFNWIFMQNVWSSLRGPYGVNLVGNDSNKSDLLKMHDCAISGTVGSGLTALTVDGYVHSVDLSWNHFVAVETGILVTNTGGGTEDPQYVRCTGLTVDFATDDCVRIETGRYMFFDCNTYLNGGYSTTAQAGSGFKIGSDVVSGTVIIDGGMIVGCGEYAIDGDSAVNMLGGDIYFANNQLGDMSSTTIFRRSFGNTTFFAQMSGANPILQFDSNDYDSYNRSTNVRSFVIGGSTIAQMNTSGLRLNTLPTSASGLSSGQLWNDGGTVKVA